MMGSYEVPISCFGGIGVGSAYLANITDSEDNFKKQIFIVFVHIVLLYFSPCSIKMVTILLLRVSFYSLVK